MKKYENFCAALKNLEDIHRYQEPYDNVTTTGLVGLYEICSLLRQLMRRL